MYTPSGTSIGIKAIANFGSLNLHGVRRSPLWTYAAEDVKPGDKRIKVVGDVSEWNIGGRIGVAPTGYMGLHGEFRTIVDIEENFITVDKPFEYFHAGKW